MSKEVESAEESAKADTTAKEESEDKNPLAESKNEDPTFDLADSSDTDEDDEHVSYSSKSNWKIDLNTFSKTRTKLETEINNSSKCSDLVSAYFGSHSTALSKLPWEERRPEYGIFPLHNFFFIPCPANDPKAFGDSIVKNQSVKLTARGEAFINELKTTHKDYYEANVYKWGSKKGPCIGTYQQMLLQPKQSVNAFRRYCDSKKATITVLTRKQQKKIISKSRRWNKHNHKIYATIVNHLDVSATHICNGVEMSNGIVLLATIIRKFGHRHAQCLAALLRELTSLRLRVKDPTTRTLETVQQFIDRALRIVHEAENHPAMSMPIPEALTKVFVLDGLVRSDEKYRPMVTIAYSTDLNESISALTDKMQTVEGMRAQRIHDEYGSSSTNLATASALKTKGTRSNKRKGGPAPVLAASGASDNEPCDLPRHGNHTKGECSTRKLKKLVESGRAAPQKWDVNGNRCCQYALNSIKCPHLQSGSCRFSHHLRGATTEKPRDTSKVNSYTTDSSSDSSSHGHSSRSSRSRRKHHHKRHNKKRSHRQKHNKSRSRRHKKVYYEYTASTSSDYASSSSLDF